ncbi:MAG: hypothetical protein ACYC0X_08530 [Pirellulaceae bacterium]
MKTMVITIAMLMTTCTVAMAQDKVDVPKEALQEMAFLVGEWEANGTTNGEEISGTYSAQWAPGNHCLILRFDWTSGSRVKQSGVGGWSPGQKQYVEHWFISDGSALTCCFSLDQETGAWVGTGTMVDKEGKESSSKIKLEKRSGQYKFTATDPSDDNKVGFEFTNKKSK